MSEDLAKILLDEVRLMRIELSEVKAELSEARADIAAMKAAQTHKDKDHDKLTEDVDRVKTKMMQWTGAKMIVIWALNFAVAFWALFKH